MDGDKKTDVTPAGFGRIAAQTAKQVILQKVREAEKDAVISYYSAKLGTIVTGLVLRHDGKNVIMDIGKGQAYMPPEEQMRGEFYKLNTRITVYISDIRDTMRGRTVIVSRAAKELVKECFPGSEISSGAVEMKSIA
jgi:N utilization substance protein A